MQPSSPNHSGPQQPADGPSYPQDNYTAPQFAHGDNQAASTHHPDYEFIMNPDQAPAKKLFVGGQSTIARLGLVLGGLLVLLIVFVVVKNALGGGTSSFSTVISVAQSQQELIHLATAANQQSGVATSTLNSTATIQASVASAQRQLTAYLKTNHQKLSVAQLNQKVSASTDAQLAAAAGAGTYDQTYREVMQTVLTSYEQSLKSAFTAVKGPKGRALLTADYNGAQLLVQQLNTN